MNGVTGKFRRFREEYARLHDPKLLRESVELLPVDASMLFARSVKGRKKYQVNEAPLLAAPSRFFGTSMPESPSRINATGDTPLIKVEPVSVTRSIHLFQEEKFSCLAPGAKNVELVWVEDSRKDRARLDPQQDGFFAGQVALPENDYLVAFAVDGYTRPPQQLAQRIVINKRGVFAPLEILRPKEKLQVTNCRRKDERVLFETQEPWIRLDRDFLDLLAFETGTVSVEFDTTAMSTGPNEGRLHLKLWREEQEVSVGVIHFAVELIVGGAIAEFSFTPRELGEIKRGNGDVEVRLEVRARGEGPLKGMISLPQSGALIDFRLNANQETNSRFTHIVLTNSAVLPLPPPHTTNADFEIAVFTDCFIANYRFRRIQIPYKLIYLKTSVPALFFNTIRAGETKAKKIAVARSDGGEVQLEVFLPAAANSFMEAIRVRPDTYLFRLNAGRLRAGTQIEETVHFVDRRSGLRDQVKVIATITESANEPPPRVVRPRRHD